MQGGDEESELSLSGIISTSRYFFCSRGRMDGEGLGKRVTSISPHVALCFDVQNGELKGRGGEGEGAFSAILRVEFGFRRKSEGQGRKGDVCVGGGGGGLAGCAVFVFLSFLYYDVYRPFFFVHEEVALEQRRAVEIDRPYVGFLFRFVFPCFADGGRTRTLSYIAIVFFSLFGCYVLPLFRP